VLALSYGASGVYALIAIIERLTRETSLASQTSTLNDSLDERPIFDLVYQLLGIAFGLAPVALVVYLLWRRFSTKQEIDAAVRAQVARDRSAIEAGSRMKASQLVETTPAEYERRA